MCAKPRGGHLLLLLWQPLLPVLQAAADTAGHDCGQGRPEQWPQAKREACCAPRGAGCPPSALVPVLPDAGAARALAAATEEYDCRAGIANWELGWSFAKKSWCCRHGDQDVLAVLHEGSFCRKGTDRPALEWYDCQAHMEAWETMWSSQKKHWCCQHRDFGCPLHPELAAAAEPHDCRVFRSDRPWSHSKLAWCCKHKDIGCRTAPPASTAAPEPYDCAAGREHWELGWSHGKRQWCCEKVEVGCPSAVKTTTAILSYDCLTGLADWEMGWSDEKRVWCCKHTNVGCRTTTLDLYDCEAGLSNRGSGWSVQKKAWCCEHRKVACPTTQTTTTSKPFDCQAGRSNWKMGWSDQKREWCCEHEKAACPAPPTTTAGTTAAPTMATATQTSSAPFDCRAGRQHWEVWWSADKKSWCCRHESFACPYSRREHTVIDCHFGLEDWDKMWLAHKRSWCCAHADEEVRAQLHEDGACSSATQAASSPTTVATRTNTSTPTSRTSTSLTSTLTTTTATATETRTTTSETLTTTGMATATSTTTTVSRTSLPFDCSAGLTNWARGWSRAKKGWCCQHKQLGCQADPTPTTTTSVPYDCRAGRSIMGLWSRGKKSWCCKHAGLACNSAPVPEGPTALVETAAAETSLAASEAYDCQVGLLDWKNTWAAAKKEWCCARQNRGCPFDCEVRHKNLPKFWSEEQKGWCCKHKGSGCPATTPEPYDCQVGLSNWESVWIVAKVEWCCKHERLGCPPGYSEPRGMFEQAPGGRLGALGRSIALGRWRRIPVFPVALVACLGLLLLGALVSGRAVRRSGGWAEAPPPLAGARGPAVPSGAFRRWSSQQHPYEPVFLAGVPWEPPGAPRP